MPLIHIRTAGSVMLGGIALVALSACQSVGTSSPVTLAQASQVLGTERIASISYAGTGRWYQFGQAAAPGTPWPAFDVSFFRADVDYNASAARVQITRRQVIEPGRARPAPVDQSVDQYVAGTVAWNRPANAAAPGAPTAQPAAVAERSAEIWSTPQGFVKAALAHQASLRPVRRGTEVSFKVGKTQYVGLLNAQAQVEQMRTWVDTPVLGDTLVETRYSNYRDFGGLSFPTNIVRQQGGHPTLEITVTEARPAITAQLAVPPEVAAAKPPAVTVTATQLAEGVHYLTGGSHHSVLVEQQDHLVVIEAPLNEERSLAVIAKSRELVPGKPIKYLVNTHAHFDHSGGLRTFVDAGAIIVTHKDNKAFYEKAWAAPRTLNPDRLATSGKTARFETFSDRHVLSDGRRSIELHEIAGNGHNDAFLLAYLPTEKLLVEADAYTPVAPNAPAPASPNPYSVNLLQNILKLKLDVAQIAALHGPRIVTLADLRTAVGNNVTAQR